MAWLSGFFFGVFLYGITLDSAWWMGIAYVTAVLFAHFSIRIGAKYENEIIREIEEVKKGTSNG